MPEVRKVNLAEAFTRIPDVFSPRIAAQVNDHQVKLARVIGDFVWHRHEVDEMFLVTKGRLTIRLRDGKLVLGPGELAVIPKGVEHCPVADEECHVVLFEPEGTLNTGDAGGERAIESPEWV
jgi:mannose-6-phosphate isomerase-like protein (cupin superfamily)